MLSIDDFEINIKKYDTNKNHVIVNLLICKELEIRGFIVRYSKTKYSPINPVWIVSPPCVKTRKQVYFWIFNLKNLNLWKELQKEIIRQVKDYTDL